MNTTSSTVESEPAKRLGSRFKKILNNGQGALNRLRSMQKREAEIAQKHKSVLDECKKVESEVATAQRAFDQNPTPDGVHKLIAIRLRSREAAEIFTGLDQRLRRGAANQEFLAEFKTELRDTLVAAAKHKLKEAEDTFENELKRARETLSKEGFDQDEILAAPKVRAAKWQVEKMERLLESITSSKDEHLWQSAAEILK